MRRFKRSRLSRAQKYDFLYIGDDAKTLKHPQQDKGQCRQHDLLLTTRIYHSTDF